jgi:methionyl aminopeptidase
MSIEGPDDVEVLRRVGRAVAEARDAMLAEVRDGISTAELDEIGRDVLRAHGARSAPLLAYDFPGWTCISVNTRSRTVSPRARSACAREIW